MLQLALETARASGVDELAVNVEANITVTSLDLRMYREAERAVRDGLEHLRELDIGFAWQDYPLSALARLMFERGRWTEATEWAERALAPARGLPLARLQALVVLGRVRARRGDPGTWPPLDEAREIAAPTGELQQVGLAAVARAEAALLAGDPVSVEAETSEAFELAALRGNAWLLGELAYLRRRAGIDEAVPDGVAEPFALQLADEHKRAAECWFELGCPYEAAVALAEAGDGTSLRRAVEEFRRLGAAPAEARAADNLREVLARGPRAATRDNPANLTPREVEVLALVAEGLRNVDIAARLVVSEKTVDHHVSAILRKLSVRSRTEASVAATRLGIA
jgi:DNA-binding CsgD family transcriptional regulator